MGVSYSPDNGTVGAMVTERLRKAHPDMHAIGLRVGVLFAENGGEPAVKHGGYPASATIKVVSHKDRVTKGYDAEMVIDSGVWDDLNDRQRASLVAHELHHLQLVVKVDKETKRRLIQYDDGGRPKLKTRPGDWNAGDGFAYIVAEFGDDAIEFRNIRSAWSMAEAAKALDVRAPQPEPSLLDTVPDGDEDGPGDDAEDSEDEDTAVWRDGDDRETVEPGDGRYYRGGGADR